MLRCPYRIAFATSVVRHLTAIGVVDTETDKSGRRVFRPKSEDSPLLLCKKAQERIYAPDGILDHLHAVHFVTFSPPFDSNRTPVDMHNDNSDAHSSLGSHCSEIVADSVEDHKHKQSSSAVCTGTKSCMPAVRCVTSSPKSVTKTPTVREDQVAPMSSESVEDFTNQESQSIDAATFEEIPHYYGRRRTLAHMVSKLRCCKHKEKAQAERSCLSAFSLTDQQEQQWKTFGMRPIAEDQSVAGHSIISMSAPLLSSQKSSERSRSFLSEF